MSIHIRDLQVLMPRADEMARSLPAAHQQELHQQALAAAAQAESERQRRRVDRTRSSENSARATGQWTARSSQNRATASSSEVDGRGRRVDVRV